MYVPTEVEDALAELSKHYSGFVFNEKGANGYLVFAKHRITEQEVAIKFYYGEPGDKQHEEPRLLASIDSQFVLPILDARGIADGWAYFVTPRCNEGDIDGLILSGPSVYRAIDVLLGICNGVSAIHAKGMVHRDLKPANAVIHESRPQIADFGSCRLLPAGETSTVASRHSILYRPPESFDSNRYDVKGDIYQIGLLAYQLLGGRLPYDGREYLNLAERNNYAKQPDQFERSQLVDSAIRRNAIAGTLLQLETLPAWLSGSAKAAIRAIANPDPDERLSSVGEVAARLSTLRANHQDWAWSGPDARLVTADRIIELRPNGNGLYEAYQKKNADFRRIPKLAAGPIRTLVQQLQ